MMISKRGYSNYPCHYTSLKPRSSNMLKQRIEPQGEKILMISTLPI